MCLRREKDGRVRGRFEGGHPTRKRSYSSGGRVAADPGHRRDRQGRAGVHREGALLARRAARRHEAESVVPQPTAATCVAARGCRGLDRPPRRGRRRYRRRHACAAPGDEQGDARDDLRCCGQGAVLAARSLPCEPDVPAVRPRRRRRRRSGTSSTRIRSRSPRRSRTRAYPGCYALSKVLEEVMLEQYGDPVRPRTSAACGRRGSWRRTTSATSSHSAEDVFGGPRWRDLVGAEQADAYVERAQRCR